MTIINTNTQSNITTPNNALIDAVTASSEGKAANENSSSVTSGDSVSISNRSKVLLEINAEFFKGGKLSFEDIPNYVSKLHEKGLISTPQFEKLGGGSKERSNNAQGELATFVGQLSDALKSESPDHALVEPLATAQFALYNLEIGKTTDSVALAKAQHDFNSFFKTEDFLSLDGPSQDGLIKINDMLGLINQTQANGTPNNATKAYASIASF